MAATILFIIAMAKVFTWLIAMKQTAMLLQNAMNALALPPWALLLLVMAGLMVIGCIMETTAALILLVPVLAALTPQMGVDPIQFGVLMVVNLAIGMLTPPVGSVSLWAAAFPGCPSARWAGGDAVRGGGHCVAADRLLLAAADALASVADLQIKSWGRKGSAPRFYTGGPSMKEFTARHIADWHRMKFVRDQ